ncbi:MAG: DEAD/DEAH box helicase [Acidimicrobiales bacterium]
MTTFTDLGVPTELLACLSKAGIEQPFPIQEKAIPDALAGRDVCGRAPTGSGKTMAFGIPLVTRVGKARPHRPKALILVPTRELASQIQRGLMPLARARKRTIEAFYGGVGFGPQLNAMRRGTDIIVACPGRLGDLIRRGAVQLDDVEIVVLDEADRMADMGFLPEVRQMLDAVKPDRQTLLFSATLDGAVDVLIRHYQNNPVRHELVVPEEEKGAVEHLFWKAPRDARVGITAHLVGRHGSTIVFCRTKRGADRVAGLLERVGVKAVTFHGDRSQAQRERALASFSAGRAQALVATDVAARGIHVDDVSCVVHFDPPADEKDYLHRSGRTGRAGSDGMVVSLVVEEQRREIVRLQRRLGLPSGVDKPEDSFLAPLEQRAVEYQQEERPRRSGGGGRSSYGGRPSGGRPSGGRPSGGGGRPGGKPSGGSAGGRSSSGRPSGGSASGRPSGGRSAGEVGGPRIDNGQSRRSGPPRSRG